MIKFLKTGILCFRCKVKFLYRSPRRATIGGKIWNFSNRWGQQIPVKQCHWGIWDCGLGFFFNSKFIKVLLKFTVATKVKNNRN